MTLPEFRCRCGRVVPEIHAWVRRSGPFASLHCSEHCPGPPPERVVAVLRLDLPRRTLVLSVAEAEGHAWLNREDVAAVWREALDEHARTHTKMRPDPRPHEDPPGPSESTPGLVARALVDRLRASFPGVAVAIEVERPAPS